MFTYAEGHHFLEEILTLDDQILETIKSLTEHSEVSQCSLADWEKTILNCYEVWRKTEKNGGGKVIVDLDTRSITYQVK